MCDGNLAMANAFEHNDNHDDAFTPTSSQIKLYKEIRKITERYHEYSDQMMAVAIWLDREFTQKSKLNN